MCNFCEFHKLNRLEIAVESDELKKELASAFAMLAFSYEPNNALRNAKKLESPIPGHLGGMAYIYTKKNNFVVGKIG